MKKILFTILLFSSLLTHATNYYFSLAGSDNYTSAQAQNQSTPWRSVSRANDVANNSYVGISALTSADTLLFRNGDVFYGSFNFTKSDVKISSYGTGNRPVITSMQQLPALTASGPNRYKSSVINSESDPRFILIDGVLTEMGRFPNANQGLNGWLFANPVTTTYETSTTGVKTSYANLPYNNWAGLSKPLTDWTGSEIVVRFNRFVCNTYTLDNADVSGKQTFSGANTSFRVPKGSSTETGEGFFLRNNLATLDTHGEWYYNSDSNIAYVYLTSFSPSGHKIEMPTINNAVITTNVSNIYINGIEFNGYNNSAVSANSGNNVILKNCKTSNLGSIGISITSTVNFRFLNSTMDNVLRYGLYKSNKGGSVYLDRDTITNIMPFLGSNQSYGGSGLYVQASNDTITHCVIRNVGYNGIEFEKSSNLFVAYNVIDSFCLRLDDGGGIYTVNNGNPTYNFLNRTIKQNIILNGANSPFPFAGMAPGYSNSSNDLFRDPIYFDEASNHILLDGNIVPGSYTKGIYFNDGSDIEMKNNIIYNAKTYSHQNAGIHDSFPDLSRPGKNYAFVRVNNNIHNNTFYSDNSSSRAIYISSKRNENIGTFGKIDTNFYSFPMNKNILFKVDTVNMVTKAVVSNGYYLNTSPSWQTEYNNDKNSKLSPVYFSTTSPPVTPSILVYNDKPYDSVVSLQGKTWISPKGIKYNTNSLTLKPYTAEVLIYTGVYTATNPPSVSITSPADGAVYRSPASITFNATATDQDGTITKVEFYNGTALLATDNTSPYTYTWSNVTAGNYSITAKAYDNTSLTTSSTVDVSVVISSLPLINITAPTGSPTFYYPESIPINVYARTVDATDSVYKVDYFAGGSLLHTETTAPFSWTWQNVQPGNYTLTAIATSGVTNLSSQPATQTITVLPALPQIIQKFKKFKYSRIKYR